MCWIFGVNTNESEPQILDEPTSHHLGHHGSGDVRRDNLLDAAPIRCLGTADLSGTGGLRLAHHPRLVSTIKALSVSTSPCTIWKHIVHLVSRIGLQSADAAT